MTQVQMIYGPPGTGKTTTLKGIILEETRNPGCVIRVVSHTKAAAAEILSRLTEEEKGRVDLRAGTVHSFAFGLAGCKKVGVVDWMKLRELSNATGIPIAGRQITDADETGQNDVGDEYLAVYGLAKAKRISYEDAYEASPRPGTEGQFLYFCDAYDRWKDQNGFYDFNDMLTMAIGEAMHSDVLIVDEAQDLSPAQWQLVRQWAGSASKVYVAGDDDQAIYVWGGADPQGMQSFEKEFNGARRVLDQSYRVPALVHSLAASIIETVQGRVDKQYRPRNEIGDLARCTSMGDVKFKNGESVMILYRNHSLRKDIEDFLLAQNILHTFDNGGRSMLQTEYAYVAREYLDKTPWTLIPTSVRKSLSKVYSSADIDKFVLTDNWPYDPLTSYRIPPRIKDALQGIRRAHGCIPHPDDHRLVHLSSIHGSKGREADHVVLINGLSGKSMQSWDTDQDNERRVFYVAVTRAKHRLTVVAGENSLTIL